MENCVTVVILFLVVIIANKSKNAIKIGIVLMVLFIVKNLMTVDIVL